MEYLKVGHTTDNEKGTGATVFLFDKPAVASYCLCGSAPASHELFTLEPESNVTHIDGLLLSGGSAFGLNTVHGMMRWFEERGRGYPTPYGRVPIVPAAAIFDLAYKKPLPPTADNIYEACEMAAPYQCEQGRVGVGTGASVGKLVPEASRMSGGLGYAEIRLSNGLVVSAYVVVNSVGDVRDKSNRIIAGACLPSGEFADGERYLLEGRRSKVELEESNTTLAAVFTNASFSKVELKRIAKMAIAGMARAITPVFSRFDGDMVFCVSLGTLQHAEEVVGTMAAEVVRAAIVNAVAHSVVLRKTNCEIYS
jgi:L-aminopeptidase/D-esterase-like protein